MADELGTVTVLPLVAGWASPTTARRNWRTTSLATRGEERPLVYDLRGDFGLEPRGPRRFGVILRSVPPGPSVRGGSDCDRSGCMGRPTSGSTRSTTLSPASGDAVVRIAACGICGTDLVYIHHGGMGGPAGFAMPLGHEFAGTVEWTGAAVTGRRSVIGSWCTPGTTSSAASATAARGWARSPSVLFARRHAKAASTLCPRRPDRRRRARRTARGRHARGRAGRAGPGDRSSCSAAARSACFGRRRWSTAASTTSSPSTSRPAASAGAKSARPSP